MARAGRRLLLSVVVDDSALDADRARALELLALPIDLWSKRVWKSVPVAVESLDEKEQINLIDHITPLLKNTNPHIRCQAAQALLEISWPQSESLKSFCTQRALSALTTAYQAEPPGYPRNALAEAVGNMVDSKRWQELCGNAHGVVVVLNPGCGQGAEAYCFVGAMQAKAEIQENPGFVFDRLDDKQKVVERKEMRLEHAKGNYMWPSERGGGFCEEFKFSMADFTPGLWRMTVKGVAGDDKAPWASEPCLLRLTPAPTTKNFNLDLKKPRIVFNP